MFPTFDCVRCVRVLIEADSLPSMFRHLMLLRRARRWTGSFGHLPTSCPLQPGTPACNAADDCCT